MALATLRSTSTSSTRNNNNREISDRCRGENVSKRIEMNFACLILLFIYLRLMFSVFNLPASVQSGTSNSTQFTSAICVCCTRRVLREGSLMQTFACSSFFFFLPFLFSAGSSSRSYSSIFFRFHSASFKIKRERQRKEVGRE